MGKRFASLSPACWRLIKVAHDSVTIAEPDPNNNIVRFYWNRASAFRRLINGRGRSRPAAMYLRWLSKLGTPLPGGHTNKAGQ